MRLPRFKRLGLSACLAATLAAASVCGSSALAQPTGAAPVPSVALPDFATLVDQVGPSVVNIRATAARARGGALDGWGGLGMDEQMQEFFRRFGLPIPRLPGVPERRGAPEDDGADGEGAGGVGSGFILSADGFIMTNAHVVDGASELIVTLHDKREFKARVVGADSRTDVAVIKIDATGLSAVRIGDVNRLRVGEWVMAIGSPFGLENTVTAGIVSAKQRDTGDYLPFIQTDVAINPGNSGGPLINLRGEVVGINSQIYSRSGGFMGISFAIPMDEALRVSEQLRQHGKVTRGRIGVSIAQVSKEVAESIGLGTPRGAMVSAVEAGSPAERAGLEPGDVITHFNGVAVDKMGDLPRMVGSTAPGTRAPITVLRRGQSHTLHVTVAQLDGNAKTASVAPSERDAPAMGSAQVLGLELQELTAAQKKELNLKGGLYVSAAREPAARAGVRVGDVILSVANTNVSTVRELDAVLAKLDKKRPVSVLLRRGQWAQYVVIRPAP